MAKIIHDLWILTENGTAVFTRVYDPDMKVQLFAMLMSALNSFASEIAKGGLSNFELSKMRFSLLKKNKFLFVASSSPKIKENKVLNELNAISEQFFKRYGIDLIDTWDGSLDMFDGFEKEINKSVEQRVQGFLDGI
jgi:hypothetical protein